MFLYIPRRWAVRFLLEYHQFSLIFVYQPDTPHLEHLKQPKSPSPELTKNLHRLNVHQTRYPVSVLLETNYIIVKLSYYDEILWNASSNSKFPWNKANSLIPTKVTWPWCYPDSFPLTIQVGVKFHQIHTGRNRGHYIMTPTQTMHCTNFREIPQNYHTLVLFDSPQKW